MKHTLKYFFSIGLLLSWAFIQAQNTVPSTKSTEKNKMDAGIIPAAPKKATAKTATATKIDTIVPVKKDRYGVRVGVDLYKLTRGLYDSNYKGIELVGDYRLTKNY